MTDNICRTGSLGATPGSEELIVSVWSEMCLSPLGQWGFHTVLRGSVYGLGCFQVCLMFCSDCSWVGAASTCSQLSQTNRFDYDARRAFLNCFSDFRFNWLLCYFVYIIELPSSSCCSPRPSLFLRTPLSIEFSLLCPLSISVGLFTLLTCVSPWAEFLC